MKAPGYLFVFWLAASVALLLLNGGCSKQLPKCADPDGQSEMHCFPATISGEEAIVCSTSSKVCAYVLGQAETYAQYLKALESVGDCKAATVTVTLKKE